MSTSHETITYRRARRPVGPGLWLTKLASSRATIVRVLEQCVVGLGKQHRAAHHYSHCYRDIVHTAFV